MQLTIKEITRSTSFNDLPAWLSAREAAVLLDVSLWFVYQNIHQGNIPYRRVGPKIIQIPKEYFSPKHALAQVTV